MAHWNDGCCPQSSELKKLLPDGQRGNSHGVENIGFVPKCQDTVDAEIKVSSFMTVTKGKARITPKQVHHWHPSLCSNGYLPFTEPTCFSLWRFASIIACQPIKSIIKTTKNLKCS